MPGDGDVQKDSTNAPCAAREDSVVGRDLALERAGIDVAHLALRARRREQVHALALEVGELLRQEGREVHDVAHGRALARPAEAAHAFAHVREEALARLLAVVADVDAAGELLRHGVAGGGLDRALELGRVHRLAAAAAREQA